MRLGPAAMVPCGVFFVAFALRLAVPLVGGGLVGNYSYDAGVYYAAGAALVNGRTPYRDFILLHPPGAALVVAPAAWIGHLTSDHAGYALATLEFTALGAASAALVVVVARRLDIGWWAASAGGLFYATWFLSIRAEYLSRLEPLGNFLMLCGLVGYTGIGGRHGKRSAVLCGAALGAAASVKIWYAVPLAVVLCFLVARQRRADVGRALVGAAAAVAIICGPFFALAPSSMWRMVVSEQLGRNHANGFRAAVTLQRMPAGLSWPAGVLLDSALLAAICVLLVTARRAPAVRLPTGLLLAGVGVLLAAPSFYVFYVDFLTPAVALCVATGAAAVALAGVDTRGLFARTRPVAGVAVIVLALVIPARAAWYRRGPASTSLPPKRLASAAATVRCVMSDSPMALVELNALDDGFSDGCPNWVDVTGRTYAPDIAARAPRGMPLARVANPRWQLDLRDYLLSGDAVIISRSKAAGISSATWQAIVRGGVLARDGTHIIYGVEARRR